MAPPAAALHRPPPAWRRRRRYHRAARPKFLVGTGAGIIGLPGCVVVGSTGGGTLTGPRPRGAVGAGTIGLPGRVLVGTGAGIIGLPGCVVVGSTGDGTFTGPRRVARSAQAPSGCRAQSWLAPARLHRAARLSCGGHRRRQLHRPRPARLYRRRHHRAARLRLGWLPRPRRGYRCRCERRRRCRRGAGYRPEFIRCTTRPAVNESTDIPPHKATRCRALLLAKSGEIYHSYLLLLMDGLDDRAVIVVSDQKSSTIATCDSVTARFI